MVEIGGFEGFDKNKANIESKSPLKLTKVVVS